jgi:hypothetical protein
MQQLFHNHNHNQIVLKGHLLDWNLLQHQELFELFLVLQVDHVFYLQLIEQDEFVLELVLVLLRAHGTTGRRDAHSIILNGAKRHEDGNINSKKN